MRTPSASSQLSSDAPRPPRIYASFLAPIGLVLIAGGGYLLSLGGSPYYLLTGLAVAGSGILLWNGRPEGAWLYAAMLVATAGWAVWESGFNGWALIARVFAPAVLGLWLLAPWFKASLSAPYAKTEDYAPFANPVVFIISAAIAVVIGFGLHQLQPEPVEPAFTVDPSPAPQASATPASDYTPAAADWPSYGGDPGGRRYSSLTQITPQNVSELKVAWTYHIGSPAVSGLGRLEVNPLKVGDTVYLCGSYNILAAVDAETGEQRWRYDPKSDRRGQKSAPCRGIVHYHAPMPVAECQDRIITATAAVDTRLIAVDAHTGALCKSFGDNGQVSLLKGLGDVPRGYYKSTSGPTLVHNKVVVNASVLDGQFWGEPSGVIRAFDAVSGKFAWAWDMGRPDDHGEPKPGETYTPSTPNSWGPMSADETLGLVYAPMGNVGGSDYYGAQRRPFDDKYSSSVVALDADTGEVRWSFQSVHHDLWDYDVGAQPVLFDIPAQDGGVAHALLMPTKNGDIFMLDRVTGRPITKVIERPVPTDGALPTERVSPTQPFSVGMPSFRGPDLRESSMWGLTPIDQMICRIEFKQARYEGLYTPPGLTPAVFNPGYNGGIDWGSVSVDPERHLMIVNANRVANYDQLLTRADADKRNLRPIAEGVAGDASGAQPQANTPYAVDVRPFLSPLRVPCQQPPFAVISAVDLITHKVLWLHPFGAARDAGPLGIASMVPITMGVPDQGASMVTASGLTFIGASQEKAFSAFDTMTGKLLWKARLPAGGQSTPTTYISSASGRQFVLIPAGGLAQLGSGDSDAFIAYALPKR